jgi:cytosine deaminase
MPFNEGNKRIGLERQRLQERKPWDMRIPIVEGIMARGGYVNAHSHLDRAYTISDETMHLADAPLEKKWDLVDKIKEDASVEDIVGRMSYAVEQMIAQGVSVIASFIDVDPVIGTKAMEAATIVRAQYEGRAKMLFINQSLKGVLDPSAREWFDKGAAFVDIIGGLPKKDEGREEEHLAVLLLTAKEMGKMVHAHVDQNNDPDEKETMQLARATAKYGMEGKVVAVHGVSIAAQSAKDRQDIYSAMKDVGMRLITCPTAWINGKRNEKPAPTHNSIAPVDELLKAGIEVGIGPDNIADIYMPYTDGDMWTELYFLLESCRFRSPEHRQQLIDIATVYGRAVLGID